MPTPAIAITTKGTGGGTAAAATSTLTAIALRNAWQFLIPSFGLTLLYINVHFLARYVGNSQRFSEFGAEWNLTRMRTGVSSIALKYGEIMALIVLDGIAAIAILLVVLMLATVVWVYAHPLEATQLFGDAIVALITGA